MRLPGQACSEQAEERNVRKSLPRERHRSRPMAIGADPHPENSPTGANAADNGSVRTKGPNRRDPRRVAISVSIAVSVLMLVGKLCAYSLTGSAAIFSDAMESIVHLLATIFVGFSLWYSFQPP